MGKMDLDDGESEGDSDSDAEDGEVVSVKTRTTGIQTGSVHEAGKKLLPTKRVQRLGDATACLKVMTPFFQLVDMRDHMRQLLVQGYALHGHVDLHTWHTHVGSTGTSAQYILPVPWSRDCDLHGIRSLAKT